MKLNPRSHLRDSLPAPVYSENDVMLKIGRNLLLYQEIEIILKCLSASRMVEGYADQLQSKRDEQIAALRKQTMGQTAGQVLDAVFSTAPDSEVITHEPESLTGVWMSFSVTIQLSHTEYEELKQLLASLLSQRNTLVHHLSASLDLTTQEGISCVALCLDEQYEIAQALFARLEAFETGLEESKKAVAEFLISEENRARLCFWLFPPSSVIEVLAHATKGSTRPDGWTDLAQAGHVLRKQCTADELADMKQQGHKTLKGLLVASEWFEVSEEILPDYSKRTLYRVAPDYTL